MALRFLGAVLIVIGAGVFGGLLGRVTAPNLIPKQAAMQDADTDGEGADTLEGASEPALTVLEPPLYVHLGIDGESIWEVVEQEVAYAAATGLHRYILPATLAWGGPSEGALANLERIHALDPEAEFLLQLTFNPPPAWFEQNPDARMTGVAGDLPLPTPASETWRQAARDAFDQLYGQLQAKGLAPHVSGYVLQGLRQGRWQGGESTDMATDNIIGFRQWLQRHYEDDGALRKAWKEDSATRESANPPDPPPANDPEPAFLRLGEDGLRIDYARYRAHAVADAIGALASHVRGKASGSATIWANYGFTFEMAEGSGGHLALGALLDSDLDGFIAPVSLANRGLGGSGGYMGPVHSALAHGKQWIIVDDTRTAIAWNDETGGIDEIRGLRPEDVYNVQRRNFALAALQGLGLAWSDPQGRGALCSEAQWALFSELKAIYRDHVAYPGSRLAMANQTYSEGGIAAAGPTLLVVADEESQFLTNDGAGLAPLMARNRDEILKAGVTTAFCLLDDVIDNRSPEADVYIFLNAYSLPSAKRRALHERLAAEAATAIWVYAAGYRDVTLMAKNISDTVGMNVKAFDGPAGTGSLYTLGGGHWLDEGQAVGAPRAVSPLFYVDDGEADVLAQFKQSEKPSVAMRAMEAGWTSVFYADPELSAPLLRELLRILERQVFFRPGKQRFFDITVAHQNLLAIHSGEVGERTVNLGQFYNIQDLFDPSIGWPQKESFVLSLESGETRLFQLNPL